MFGPPYSQDVCGTSRGCIVVAKIGLIRDAVSTAFSSTPADLQRREKLASEEAGVWVLNGTGQTNRGSRLAGYLEYQGLAASAPRQKPADGVPATTQITVYNGAETRLPETIAYLEELFGVKVKTAADATIATDIVVVIGRDTPDLEAPPSS